jgi:beta-fructofuranosidase
MLVHPGNHIGDSWYLVEGGSVHCYYLTCPETLERHTAWDIAHATSDNLVDWELQGIVLERGDAEDWDGSCLATGSVLRAFGRYWMAYTGRWNEPGVAVGLAVSDDPHCWAKVPYNPITRIDERYYEPVGSGSRPFPHWRDPFLFEYDGFVYHFVCARAADGPVNRRGAVGVARSADMVSWEVLPALKVDPVAEEYECPQVRLVGGSFHLVFSAFPEISTDICRERFGHELRFGTYAMRADSWFGPFSMERPKPLADSDHPPPLYAGQVLEFEGSHYLLGTVWSDVEQDYISDPIRVRAHNRSLVAEPPADVEEIAVEKTT